MLPDEAITTSHHPPHLVVVCAPAAGRYDAAAIAWLQHQAEKNLPLGGIAGGSLLLAQAGLLDGYRHVLPGPQSLLNRDQPTPSFEFDGDRMTCISPRGALEMMLHVIGAEHGTDLAKCVREHLVIDGLHPTLDGPNAFVKERLAQTAPRLLTAITLMEANGESPLSPAELASRVGLSLRHLERLFQEYYLGVRLEHARGLLRNTNLSVSEVSRAIGLISGSYFSRRYRERFRHTPTPERE